MAKAKRIDIEMTPEIERLMIDEQKHTGQTKRAIARMALSEWLRKREKERSK